MTKLRVLLLVWVVALIALGLWHGLTRQTWYGGFAAAFAAWSLSSLLHGIVKAHRAAKEVPQLPPGDLVLRRLLHAAFWDLDKRGDGLAIAPAWYIETRQRDLHLPDPR